MYYDHFLAANFHYFHQTPLATFTSNVYKTVQTYEGHLPKEAERILHYMAKGNWLLSYARIKGIEQALYGIGQRTRFISNLEHAGQSLRSDYRHFHQDFMIFFPKAISFVKDKTMQL
jgi:acyl carrier protein phosphodiesterase